MSLKRFADSLGKCPFCDFRSGIPFLFCQGSDCSRLAIRIKRIYLILIVFGWLSLIAAFFAFHLRVPFTVAFMLTCISFFGYYLLSSRKAFLVFITWTLYFIWAWAVAFAIMSGNLSPVWSKAAYYTMKRQEAFDLTRVFG